uniref:F-box domain-containing protein n=1 Tax=Strongyloides papillosus TaxID=174720 RepID=A0A0N5CCV5_STREA
MDSNKSTEVSNLEEGDSEVQYDMSVLPDEVIGIILSKLSWKDINKVKFVSKKLYGMIHKNYHKLERKKVQELSIRYYGDCRRYPFFIKIGVMAWENVGSDVPRYGPRTRIERFKNGEELSNFLKTADLRCLNKLNIPAARNIDIFTILNKSFQEGTNINTLNIVKLLEENLNSFQTFIGKLSSVREIVIKRVCFHSAGSEDNCLLLSSLLLLNGIERLSINECRKTNFLTADMVTRLFKNKLNLVSLNIETRSVEFVENVFKEFFKMEQPRKRDNKCDCNRVFLTIYFNGEYELLLDILRSNLNEVESVVEETDTSTPEDVSFASNVDCKYCLRNKHIFSRYFVVWDNEFASAHRRKFNFP